MHYYSLGGARKGIDGALIASRPRHNRLTLIRLLTMREIYIAARRRRRKDGV
jgi:hypothetical protein